jgi:anaerobic selenocysteine-containing dehydrogenase
MTAEFVPSACPHDCPSTCALEVERLDSRTIGKVRGAKDNDYTQGVICAKVAGYKERIHNPNRLMLPLRRTGEKGDGQFSPISWDEALDEIVHNFKKASDEFGAESVWPYDFAGTMGLVQRGCINLLRHAFGYSRQDSTICTRLSWTGWLAGTGSLWGTDPREMTESDLIVVWGGNPVSTQVNVMTHIAKARKSRGAKLVVIDPYRTPTAEAADVHLALKPGTDGALAAAVMHVLFSEGMTDDAYMAKYTDAPERLKQHLTTKTPAWASAITGLSETEIIEFAHLYGKTTRSYIRVGYGFSRSRNGAANMHAVSCIPAVTGAWQHRGGGAMHSNSGMYNIDETEVKGLDMMDETVRALDMSKIGRILTNDPDALLGGPPVKAMFIQNMNPAEVAPETNKVLEGFKRDDLFTCVHEQFMTGTAQLADIVLPATMFLEHDDLYRGGGHVYLQATRKVIDAPGECRSNLDVVGALGRRLGSDHPGFTSTAWDLMDRMLRSSGMPGAEEAVKLRWIECAKSFDDMHYLNGFSHDDGKFHFAPDWQGLGPDHEIMPAMPDHLENIESTDENHPFRLVTAPARRFLNSSFTASPSSIKKEVRPTAMVHPEICAELGLSDGDRVRLGNGRGTVVVHLKPFDGLQRDVIIVEGIWPNQAFEEKIGINALVGADGGPPNGGAVFHDTSIWMRAA